MRGRNPSFGAAAWMLSGLLVLLVGNGAFAQEGGGAASDSLQAIAGEKSVFDAAWRFLADLFELSTRNLNRKIARIGVILLIGLLAKLFMDLVQMVSRFLVYSERGPLKYIFRNHQRSITREEEAERVAELLERIGAEMEKQFCEILMETPRGEGLLELETGELFVRLKAAIWPAQQWVVDAQLVPRLREILKREGIEIPGDRVVSFYHFPERKGRGGGGLRPIRRTGSAP